MPSQRGTIVCSTSQSILTDIWVGSSLLLLQRMPPHAVEVSVPWFSWLQASVAFSTLPSASFCTSNHFWTLVIIPLYSSCFCLSVSVALSQLQALVVFAWIIAIAVESLLIFSPQASLCCTSQPNSSPEIILPSWSLLSLLKNLQ